ncbi:hypothetical protein L208DRAFT_1406967 [Tricholoma matsutake]|nr:hypothetical protein L208DRAFT_1406967 [Tricholoma matsutake 945]
MRSILPFALALSAALITSTTAAPTYESSLKARENELMNGLQRRMIEHENDLYARLIERAVGELAARHTHQPPPSTDTSPDADSLGPTSAQDPPMDKTLKSNSRQSMQRTPSV